MAKITASYGNMAVANGVSTGFIYGGGYGKDDSLAAHANRAAKWLVSNFGLSVQIRGNSDGRSTGAHYDGKYCMGLGARKHTDDHIYFEALFGAKVKDAVVIESTVPNRGGFHLEKSSRDYAISVLGEKVKIVTVYSPHFDTMAEAWLG